MYCKNCGNEVMDGAAFCTKCGFALNSGTRFCHNCGKEVANGAATTINLCQEGINLCNGIVQLLAKILLAQRVSNVADVGDDTI